MCGSHAGRVASKMGGLKKGVERVRKIFGDSGGGARIYAHENYLGFAGDGRNFAGARGCIIWEPGPEGWLHERGIPQNAGGGS